MSETPRSRLVSEEVLIESCSSEPLLGNRAVMRTYSLELPRELLEESRHELVMSKASGVGKFTAKADYFKAVYPRTLKLGNLLSDELLEDRLADLSFIRASKERPSVFADNLHYDARYVGYSERRNVRGTFWRPSKSVELWRQVINLHDKPRHLQIIDASLKSLDEEGIDIYAVRPIGRDLGGFGSPKAVPSELLAPHTLRTRSKVYEIPPYDGKNLPVLEFWSSRLLHAGITGKDGQLMAAAGQWVKPGETND